MLLFLFYMVLINNYHKYENVKTSGMDIHSNHEQIVKCLHREFEFLFQCEETCIYSDSTTVDNICGHWGLKKPVAKANTCAAVVKPAIQYSRNALMNIGNTVKHRKSCKRLQLEVILKVRTLKLQRRRCKRGKRGGFEQRRRRMLAEQYRGVNRINLIEIQLEKDCHVKTRSKHLSIGLANMRSVKNKDLLLKDNLVEENIDMCVLTETWLNNNDQHWIESTELNKSGLKMDNSFREDGRKGGGVSLVYKDTYRVVKLEEKHLKTYHSVKWGVTLKNDHLDIIGLYRPPATLVSTTITQFTDEFLENIQDDIINCKNLIIMGDFNVHINDETDCDAQAFKDCTEAAGLIQHVETFTHKHGHILDHVYTLGNEPVVYKCSTSSFISDHCMVITDISIQRGDIERRIVTQRNYKKLDLNNFRQDLHFQWHEENTLEELVVEYSKVAEESLNKNAPKRKLTVTRRKQELWYNERIIEQKRKVRRLERIWRHCIEDHHWMAYTTERNRLNRMIAANKKEMLCLQVAQCGKDSKKLFALMNSMCGTHKYNQMPIAESENVLAEEFAEYFLQKIQNIRDSLKDYAHYCPTGECQGSLSHFEPVTELEVRKTILTLSTKSCELDELPTALLKQCLDQCITIITRIMNVSLRDGLFVPSWKTACVRPLLKKAGLETIYSNYRPVSNLNFLSKVLEKLVLQQFNNHCAKFHLYPDYQSAYRQYFSCETALIKIVDDILWNMEDRKVTALACIDLSAAFDTVDHGILLDVMQQNFGITDTALQWFATYLQPREFMVNVGEAYSSSKALTFSVPQGSCIGPTLYSVYASTMSEVVPPGLDIHGYADDHAIKIPFISGMRSEEEKALIKLEHCLKNIRDWMNVNRLKMNDSKTEFVVFGSQQQLAKMQTTTLNVNNTLIESAASVKYLGVYLDQNMNLKQQITVKCKTASWNLYRIKNIRKYLTQEACTVLVLGLVVVHLDYANSLFFGLPEKEIQRLQRVQNLAAKVILGRKKRDSATKSLKDLHWLPVHLRIEYKILVTVFKCVHYQAPGYLIDMIQTRQATRATRSAEDRTLLAIPKTRKKTHADRGFRVAGPKLWNQLPQWLRNQDSFDDFKRKLKTFLFSKF